MEEREMRSLDGSEKKFTHTESADVPGPAWLPAFHGPMDAEASQPGDSCSSLVSLNSLSSRRGVTRPCVLET